MRTFILSTIFAISLVAQGNNVIIPFAQSGGGVQTEMTFINNTAKAMQVMVDFRMDDGNGGRHAVTVGESEYRFLSFVLWPLGSKRIATSDPQWWTASGYVNISWIGVSGPLVTAEMVRGSERISVDAQNPANKLWLPFDNVGGTTTVSVVKTGPSQNLVFEYYDENGVVIGSHRGLFPDRDQILIRTDQYAPSVAGKRGIVAVYPSYPEKGAGLTGYSIFSK